MVSTNTDYSRSVQSFIYTGVVATTGRELWKSDGTPGGTGLVKDIFLGSSAKRSQLLYRGERDAVLHSQRWSLRHRVVEERWHSGRYGAGQRHLARQLLCNPRNLTNANGTLFFAANNGVTGVRVVEKRWH